MSANNGRFLPRHFKARKIFSATLEVVEYRENHSCYSFEVDIVATYWNINKKRSILSYVKNDKYRQDRVEKQ